MPFASTIEASIMATFALALAVLLLELRIAGSCSGISFCGRRFWPCGSISITIPVSVIVLVVLIDPFAICFLLVSIPPVIVVILVVVTVILIVLVVELVRILPPAVLILAVEDVLVVLLIRSDPQS